jgi:hypothetical protein
MHVPLRVGRCGSFPTGVRDNVLVNNWVQVAELVTCVERGYRTRRRNPRHAHERQPDDRVREACRPRHRCHRGAARDALSGVGARRERVGCRCQRSHAHGAEPRRHGEGRGRCRRNPAGAGGTEPCTQPDLCVRADIGLSRRSGPRPPVPLGRPARPTQGQSRLGSGTRASKTPPAYRTPDVIVEEIAEDLRTVLEQIEFQFRTCLGVLHSIPACSRLHSRRRQRRRQPGTGPRIAA